MKTEHTPVVPFLSRASIVFLSVYRTRSFSKTAEILSVTQSAISQQIEAFEKRLGFELFNRRTRPMTPTKEAELLNEKLLRQNQELIAMMHELQNKNYVHPFIRIGVVDSVGRSVGAHLVSKLRNQGYRLALFVSTSDSLHQKLLLDEVDVIICTGHFQDSPNLDQRFLFSEPHIVILPKEIASKRTVWQWRDLQYCGLPLIRYTSNTASGMQAEWIFSQVNLDLPAQIIVDDNPVVFSLVEKRMGWTLSQPLAVLQHIERLGSCSFIPAPKPCSSRELMVVRKQSTPPLVAERVILTCRHCLLEYAVPAIKESMPWTHEELFMCNEEMTKRTQV